MKKIFQTVLSIMVTGALFSIQAIDGFAIWSKGSGCESELNYTELKGMKPTETKVAVQKGPGADIWPVISYDGQWVAWCRSEDAFNAIYGKCDYHEFAKWNLYIANIDGGNTLPAKPIKVANGYLPQWGDDAKYPDKDKTLYFTEYSTQNIMKTTIRPDGSFTQPEKHATCLVKVQGTSAHTQGSPDGRYISFRPDSIQQVQDNTTNKIIVGAAVEGFHPHWGPRSKYLLWASRKVCRIDDGKITMKETESGLGRIWKGISNDAYWDDNKLWIIGDFATVGPPMVGLIYFMEVDISGDGYKIDSAKTYIGRGTASDIHVWGPFTNVRQKTNNTIGTRTNFPTKIIKSVSGSQFIITSEKLSPGSRAALYDLQGKQKVLMNMFGSPEDVLPLNNIADGRYFLKLSRD